MMAKPATRQSASSAKSRTANVSKPTQAVAPLGFGIRFKAWWEGYDAAALQAHLIARLDAAKSIDLQTNNAVQPETLVAADSWDAIRVEVTNDLGSGILWSRWPRLYYCHV